MKHLHCQKLTLLLLFWTLTLNAVTEDALNKSIENSKNPFNYPLQLQMIPGSSNNEDVLICLHGMGSDYTVARLLKAGKVIPHHLVSFNFPDNKTNQDRSINKTSYGTFDELLPVLYAWKTCVVDAGTERIHLYGFSAGGGALINSLAVLCSDYFDDELRNIGIGPEQKQQMLNAVQQGSVILEAPLKSFDEIAETFGSKQTKFLGQRAKKNGMRPIDNLNRLNSLTLNYFIYFDNPDEALGNRDDNEFIKRVRQNNSNGRTIAIIGNCGGHTAYHKGLWQAYQTFLSKDKIIP